MASVFGQTSNAENTGTVLTKVRTHFPEEVFQTDRLFEPQNELSNILFDILRIIASSQFLF